MEKLEKPRNIKILQWINLGTSLPYLFSSLILPINLFFSIMLFCLGIALLLDTKISLKLGLGLSIITIIVNIFDLYILFLRPLTMGLKVESGTQLYEVTSVILLPLILINLSAFFLASKRSY